MSVRWLVLISLAWLSMARTVAGAPGEVPADRAATWAPVIRSLASGAGPQKDEAIAKIRADGDATLVPAIEAYRAGLLADRDGRLVIYQSKVPVGGQGEAYPLVDAITLAPLLGTDGKPIFEASLADPMLRAARGERGELTSMVSELSLLEPDMGKRVYAIISVGERADATFLPALERQLAKATGEWRLALDEAIARIQIERGTMDQRISAARALGATKRQRVTSSLGRIVDSYEALKRTEPRLRDALAGLANGTPPSPAELKQIASGLPSGSEAFRSFETFAITSTTQPAPAVPTAAQLETTLKLVQQGIGDGKTRELYDAAKSSLAQIRSYQNRVGIVQHTFYGLSQGSIYVLLALGLAITFGLMGVINMAHGEFMMVGAFTTFGVAKLFEQHLPGYFDYYFIAAVPAAFLAAAVVGIITERLVIKHLYGRPLETLLATFGVGLFLIQAARTLFGDTLSVSSPSWMRGGIEVATDLVFPNNRLFIIGFCVVCIAGVYLIVSRTKFGLLLRATTQNREMASALGVSTLKVDALTMGFGAGLAGLAGCMVPMFDKINPNIGQGYIVDSFMTVVLGGVGNLAGVIVAGLGLGFIGKYAEALIGGTGSTIYAKVLLLGLVIFFLQVRPKGLFPAKGRFADA